MCRLCLVEVLLTWSSGEQGLSDSFSVWVDEAKVESFLLMVNEDTSDWTAQVSGKEK